MVKTIIVIEWWQTSAAAWSAFEREFAGHLGLAAPPK
jgi:hypothetical protein